MSRHIKATNKRWISSNLDAHLRNLQKNGSKSTAAGTKSYWECEIGYPPMKSEKFWEPIVLDMLQATGYWWIHSVYVTEILVFHFGRSWDTSVGTEMGYGLHGLGLNPGRSKICSSPKRPDWLCSLPSLLPSDIGGDFPGSKETGAWSWPLTSI
jgi:hypothetical protein